MDVHHTRAHAHIHAQIRGPGPAAAVVGLRPGVIEGPTHGQRRGGNAIGRSGILAKCAWPCCLICAVGAAWHQQSPPCASTCCRESRTQYAISDQNLVFGTRIVLHLSLSQECWSDDLETSSLFCCGRLDSAAAALACLNTSTPTEVSTTMTDVINCVPYGDKRCSSAKNKVHEGHGE